MGWLGGLVTWSKFAQSKTIFIGKYWKKLVMLCTCNINNTTTANNNSNNNNNNNNN